MLSEEMWGKEGAFSLGAVRMGAPERYPTLSKCFGLSNA